MSRRVFKKALTRIESRSYESNISRLNDELKKTGMLSEKMTTSTVLPPTETQPYIPPTSSPAPLGDLSDLDTFAWDNSAQGDGSSISHDFSQLATTDVNGETKPILEIPSISTTDGTGFTGTVYGLAFGVNTAVTGTPLGYINENGFKHVYQINNVFSVTHSQFSRALVDYYEANTFVQKPIYLWTSLRYRGGQLVTPVQTNGNKGLYGHSLLIPVDSNGNIKRNNIITDLGQPRTIVLNRLDDPSAPDYHEGDFSRFLANLLNVGKQAFDYLVGASDDFLSGDPNSSDVALQQASERQKAISNDPKVAKAAEQLGTAGKVFYDYLTNKLPDVIDNDYLGSEYVKSIFNDAQVNQLGTVTVGDNIVGTGGKATYNSETNEVSIPFNYDFKTNDQEFSDPSKAGYVSGPLGQFRKAVLNALGPYTADAQIATPIAPLNSLAGIVFGTAIGVSKALGGAQQKKGNVTINADELKKLNPVFHTQVVSQPTQTQTPPTQTQTPKQTSTQTQTPPPPPPTQTPPPSKSSVPSLYQNRSSAWIAGAVGSSSVAELTDQFRGTTVDANKVKGLSDQAKSYQKQIAKIGAGASTLENESKIKRLQVKLNNTREQIKSEIDGSKPNYKPIIDAPKASDDQVELEKNIEASLKQLEIDNEQLKGEALRRNIGLAVDLGLDILTAVTLLTPIPGDEAAAITAQAARAGAKTGAKTVAQRQTIDAFRREVTDVKTLTRAQQAINRAGPKFSKDVAIPIKVQGKTINVNANKILRNKGFKVDSYEPVGKVLSEGWQSPDHTNVEKDSKTRWFNPNAGTDSAKWFDPKEVKPAYPAKAPPKMIDGYSATSNLAPKSVEKSPAIKLTKKDLLRNHRLKDSEVKDMMQTIDRINKFIAAHPEELIYAKSRYPKHDPRLAELNWKMDQMLKASGDYLDKQFPENERLFDKVKSATKRSIDLTDPETYKKDPGDLSSIGNLARVDHVMNYYEPKDRTVSKIKMENRKSVNRFFEKPKRPDRPAFLRKKK